VQRRLEVVERMRDLEKALEMEMATETWQQDLKDSAE
jgi:hypothetical protein